MNNRKFHYYKAFGLNILSEFILPADKQKLDQEYDLIIKKGIVPDELGDAVNRSAFYQVSPNGFLLNIEGIAKYFARNGNEIIVQPTGIVNETEVSSFIHSTVFGAIMHQRKMLPLHASTIIFHGKALIIAGISGSGKSSLAATFLKKGGQLVSDDLSVIKILDGEVIVLPAFPVIKLWEDSLRNLSLLDDKLMQVRPELKKYYLPVKQFNYKPVKIDHICILRSHNKLEFHVNELFGVDKFNLLKLNTYLFRGIPKTGLERNHFILISNLASKLPVIQISRPNFEFNTEELFKIIINHLGLV